MKYSLMKWHTSRWLRISEISERYAQDDSDICEECTLLDVAITKRDIAKYAY